MIARVSDGANLCSLLPPDPTRWHRTTLGYIRVDGVHVIVTKTCSTVAIPGHGEVMAWRQDYAEPFGDATACCDLVDELVPVDPLAVPVSRLVMPLRGEVARG